MWNLLADGIWMLGLFCNCKPPTVFHNAYPKATLRTHPVDSIDCIFEDSGFKHARLLKCGPCQRMTILELAFCPRTILWRLLLHGTRIVFERVLLLEWSSEFQGVLHTTYCLISCIYICIYVHLASPVTWGLLL